MTLLWNVLAALELIFGVAEINRGFQQQHGFPWDLYIGAVLLTFVPGAILALIRSVLREDAYR